MYQEIMSLALGNGLWAALFCLLFVHQLKDSKLREKKYSAAIESLTDSLKSVKEIKEDCTAIADTLDTVKGDCKTIKSDCTAIKSGIKQVKVTVKNKEKPVAASGRAAVANK